jgi:hypothetical protein
MLSFTGVSPASRAASMPSMTCSNCPLHCVIRSKRPLSIESRLMLTRSSPASFRLRALLARNVPFVVRETSFNGGSAFKISSRSFLSSGSPPENFTRSTPYLEAIRTRRAISSTVISLPESRSPSL